MAEECVYQLKREVRFVLLRDKLTFTYSLSTRPWHRCSSSCPTSPFASPQAAYGMKVIWPNWFHWDYPVWFLNLTRNVSNNTLCCGYCFGCQGTIQTFILRALSSRQPCPHSKAGAKRSWSSHLLVLGKAELKIWDIKIPWRPLLSGTHKTPPQTTISEVKLKLSVATYISFESHARTQEDSTSD